MIVDKCCSKAKHTRKTITSVLRLCVKVPGRFLRHNLMMGTVRAVSSPTLFIERINLQASRQNANSIKRPANMTFDQAKVLSESTDRPTTNYLKKKKNSHRLMCADRMRARVIGCVFQSQY